MNVYLNLTNPVTCDFRQSIQQLVSILFLGIEKAVLGSSAGRVSGRIVGYEQIAPAPPEALRQAVHRLARIAGATKVGASTRLTRELRRAPATSLQDWRTPPA